MNGKHVPDEGPPGLERHRYFLPFYHVILDILAKTISQTNVRTEDADRVIAWLATALPLDRRYVGPPETREMRLGLMRPAGFREFESTTNHPLHNFFDQLEPRGVQAMRQTLGRLEAMFFPTHQLVLDDHTANPRISIFYAYLVALQKRNAHMERVDKIRKLKAPEEWACALEEKERLLNLLRRTSKKAHAGFLRVGNLLAFGLRRSLFQEKHLDNSLVIMLVDQMIELGGIELALCRLPQDRIQKAMMEIDKFMAIFPIGSPIYESLAAIYAYFAALKRYLNAQRQIIDLSNTSS
jgi:hypothetical protein